MRRFPLLNVAGLLLLSVVGMSTAAAQSPAPSLLPGDPAPALKADGWIKGNAINNFQKGKVYVVEFWATWCGPCIKVMPHLSDLADKYRGKIEFISVNTADYNRNDKGEVSETNEAHKARVKDWVAKNDDKMRYNLAYDDVSNTINKTWMKPAGRNGIPCAFIVNQESQIAWVGHPSEMDKPLEQVYAGEFKLAEFREKFSAELVQQQKAQEEERKLGEQIKAGNMAAVDAYLEGTKNKWIGFQKVMNACGRYNSAMSFPIYEKYLGKVPDVDPMAWMAYAASISTDQATTPEQRQKLVTVCEQQLALSKTYLSLCHGYLAQTQSSAGNKAEAAKNIAKAYELLEKEDKGNQEVFRRILDNLAKSIS
jgi:thiol-disulfide isomerase/thioredoxin